MITSLARLVPAWVVVFAVTALSCGSQDSNSPGDGGIGGNGNDTITGTFAVGFVFDDRGIALSDVTVRTGASSAKTDSRGRFSIPIPASGTTVLTFERDGDPPSYRRVTPTGAQTVSVHSVLTPTMLETSVDLRDESATLSVGDAELLLPAGSVVLEDGTQPAGAVEVRLTYIPRDRVTAGPPAPMVGTDGSQTESLVTYGMIAVDISYNGESANLAPNSPATLVVPSLPGDPEEAGLFFVDPQQGLWVLEGTATNDGTNWSAEIPHFSWINIDGFLKVPKEDCACLRFVTRTSNLEPLPGVSFDIRFNVGAGEASVEGYTDRKGELCHECYPASTLIEYSCSGFLDRDAPDWLTNENMTSTTMLGAECDSEDCAEVVIEFGCQTDKHCASDQQCNNGVCITRGGSEDPGSDAGSDAGSGDVSNNGSCTYTGGDDGSSFCIMQPNIPKSIVQKSCSTAGQTWSDGPCPEANAIGACTRSSGEVGEQTTVVYLAQPTPDDVLALQDDCQNTSGNWQQPYSAP